MRGEENEEMVREGERRGKEREGEGVRSKEDNQSAVSSAIV